MQCKVSFQVYFTCIFSPSSFYCLRCCLQSSYLRCVAWRRAGKIYASRPPVADPLPPPQIPAFVNPPSSHVWGRVYPGKPVSGGEYTPESPCLGESVPELYMCDSNTQTVLVDLNIRLRVIHYCNKNVLKQFVKKTIFDSCDMTYPNCSLPHSVILLTVLCHTPPTRLSHISIPLTPETQLQL